jgi:hypothetical protein
MQSWRKGKKENQIPPQEKKETLIVSLDNDKNSNDNNSNDGVPKKNENLQLNNNLAPLQFFKTCRKLSSISLQCFEKNPEALQSMEYTLRIIGLTGDEPSDKDASELGQHMMDSFYTQFKEYFPMIMKKDSEIFSVTHDIFLNMDAKNKWNLLSKETQEEVWTHMAQLVQYSNLGRMYTLCPSKMMNMITEMAEKVSKKVTDGEMDLASLNPMEMGQSLVSSLSQEELNEIGKTMMQKDTIESMMEMMNTSMKSLEVMQGGGSNLPQFPEIMNMFSKMR